jgi:NTE family protein
MHDSPKIRTMIRTATALAALVLAGCSTLQPARNPPAASTADRSAQYRVANLARGDNSDALLLSLTFSGGGMRSAAASYHLLDALRRQPVRIDGRDGTLLQEVDFMSSVSGGSITAAYYALHRDRLFEDYAPRVLHRDLQGEILGGVFNPRRAWALSSMYYGRGDYLADYFDRVLFEGKTFDDLPRQRPFIRIGATDMIDGKRVEFTQDSFDDLCSELGPVPIARAVAASAAVPGVFSPVNVADYSDYGQCPGDEKPRRYRHLIDGGVVDNLGISGPLQAIGRYDGLVKTMRRFGFRGIRNYAIVVLNVESDPRDPHDGEPRVPGLWRTVNAAINGNMRMDSQALAALLRQRAVEWQRQIASDPEAVRSGVFATSTPKVFLIEIGFDKVADPALRARLQSIPTALHLAPGDDVLLADFVRDALRDSVEYQALLATLADEAEHGPPPVSPLPDDPGPHRDGTDPDAYRTLDGEKPASDAVRPDAHPEPPR